MTTITFKDGSKAKVVKKLTKAHKSIQPPYHMEGGYSVKMIRPHLGFYDVLPEGMEKLYSHQIEHKEIFKIESN